jgi:CheY-like chemotaxis protein
MHQPTILVVDDDPDILETTAFALRKRGFDVLGAHDGPTAVEICRERQGQVDALVADLSIPGDQSRFPTTIAAEFPTIKIVYATGIPRHIALSTGMVQANAPYLQKPVDADLLASVLRGELLDAG